MNTTIAYGVTPANYTPLMCLMSQKFHWKDATVSDQRNMMDCIYAVMRPIEKTKNNKTKKKRNSKTNNTTQNKTRTHTHTS